MEPALTRLSPRQRELLEAWLPGLRVSRDLSWGPTSTRVLLVEHAGESYVVKASASEDHHVVREVAAHQRWLAPWRSQGRASVMVRHDPEARMLLTTWLPGSLAEGRPQELDPDVHRQAGALLRLLHGQEGEATLDPAYEQRENDRLLASLDRPHRLSPAALQRLREEVPAWPTPAARLVPTHGDWQPRNWLVDDAGHVRAIDLGRADLRPAASDLARLAVQQWRVRPDLEDAFRSGYGADPRADHAAWRRVLVREAVGTAVWAYAVGDQAFEAQGHRMVAESLGTPTWAPLRRRWETPRLVLTPWDRDDADWLARLFTARGRGAVEVTEAYGRVELGLRNLDEVGIGPLALRRRTDGVALGYVALVLGRTHVDEPELAYELLPEHHGHGYATEAATALLEAAWATGRRRLWLTTRPENLASLRVAAKLGFTEDHRTEDERGPVVWLRLETP